MVDAGIRNRELVLPPGTYAYVLDSTKGKVSAYVGPYKNSLSETDQLVIWDTKEQRYLDVDSPQAATRTWALAEQGQYIVLSNPASGLDHPPKGTATEAADLENGQRVIVPGPATFPLWPGQTAQTIDGHHLRHNQYVIARVYDEELAQANWRSAVMAPQSPVLTGDGGDGDGEGGENIPAAIIAPEQSNLDTPQFTMGQLSVVPGTQVSFYMPSTGMEVVPEGGVYVRDAVTLETLEYCILLDENGQKRYVRGPAVVFPNPTETFKVNENSSRIFDAIELNEQSGIYVKVIEAYDDADGTHHPVGQELFITGSEQAIYFPRAEHSIITYGGKRKHHAIAVPAGEGRYVLDRSTGDVELVRGPTMLLPDPRTEVIVRRILDPHDVDTMYPGNVEALHVNQNYAAQRASDSADYLENAEVRRSLRANRGQRASFAGNEQPVLAASAGESFLGDTLSRGTTYSPPRTITLDTKYEGAVGISIWPGYAVLVTDKMGSRRVEVGPKVVLLDYDETIMALHLSTGRPKTDDNLLQTGYLRVVNNVVSDVIEVETRDLVKVSVSVSYRVNFEGKNKSEQERWFDVENYVQVLTDHCRSRLRNAAKRSEILDFYTNAIDIIRDTILGEVNENDRPGLAFAENGMRVYDVEVLGVVIGDNRVERLLAEAQSSTLTGVIQLTMAQEESLRLIKLEDLKRVSIREKEITAATTADAQLEQIQRDLEARLAQTSRDLSLEIERQKVAEKTLEMDRVQAEQAIALTAQRNELEMARFTAETTEVLRRIDAVQPGFIEAITTFGNKALVEQIVTAIAPAALASGVTTADILGNIFEGTPLESVVKTFAVRPLAVGSQ